MSCLDSNEQLWNVFLLPRCFPVSLWTRVMSLFNLPFLPVFESEFLNVWLWHTERSRTHIWHDLYKYCLKHWPGWKALFLSHRCSVLFAWLWIVAVTWSPHYLMETNSFITAYLSEIKPREMPRNYLFNPRKLCLFKVNWFKRFFVCLFAATLEMVCYKNLDLFFWVFCCKLENLGTKE